jgi:hypothetical protein
MKSTIGIESLSLCSGAPCPFAAHPSKPSTLDPWLAYWDFIRNNDLASDPLDLEIILIERMKQ